MLNVPYWSDNMTEVFSLTFLSGPCNIPNTDTLPWNGSLQQFPAIPRCSMRTSDSKTLVQTLQRDAGINTTQPLLIRLVQNVTLGPDIMQSIPIRRPIVLLGMVSAPTSVDLAMVVNQLNVTLPYGKITWQSVALENLAPGEAGPQAAEGRGRAALGGCGATACGLVLLEQPSQPAAGRGQRQAAALPDVVCWRGCPCAG